MPRYATAVDGLMVEGLAQLPDRCLEFGLVDHDHGIDGRAAGERLDDAQRVQALASTGRVDALRVVDGKAGIDRLELRFFSDSQIQGSATPAPSSTDSF